MPHPDTAEVIKRFNDAFVERDADKLVDLVADDCVMESTQRRRTALATRGMKPASAFGRS
jgi:ketosteroid isomerase-like protein